MSKAKIADKVKIHFTGYLKDGTVFNSTGKDNPVVFTIGERVGVPGIGNAVAGMKEGEVKSVRISPKDAYGEHRDNLVTVVDRAKLSGNIDVRLGMELKARTSTGIMKDVTVRDISETSITVDANHPLAGQELKFEIVLVEIIERRNGP